MGFEFENRDVDTRGKADPTGDEGDDNRLRFTVYRLLPTFRFTHGSNICGVNWEGREGFNVSLSLRF
jgi:hypothetical protein